MKHLFTALLIVFISLTAVAQETDEGTPSGKTVSKKEAESIKAKKDAAKARKEANLIEVFKTLQATSDEQAKMREFIKESGEYGKELRSDPDFTDEEKTLKAKVYAKIKNARIRELLGNDRYKTYKDITNAQKAKDKQ